ncbi:MAG: peptidase M20 [Microgenomates group bacterium GW2011_GWC1_37_8]|uniref:Peptidase M20 n=1 Tax=Candidatus Woesebacteria bacterium GW2011_GWB1_38_8 TaxID=1618570 RepID=A0A0G0P958_9BACT|nr:MAG: peptidase M20 [Microgenomates group bacterium GW2011_GWC1_37_8]KKQ85861.1 MAG: peptidase M20 [Candidatus Woesebacteria bacterium GW2011_GWB1_38_8]
MENQILSLSKKLISVASTKEGPKLLAKVLDVARKEITEFKIKEFEKNGVPSLLASNKYSSSKFKLILNAHLDVVPANKSRYKPTLKSGKLYGRGAYDMKAAAAVEILVFKEIAKKVNYPLGLQLVTDEEVGGFSGTKYQIAKGIKADFVIAGEPTDFGVNNKAKGIVWAKVKAKGKSAHGAYPWLGENAILKINDFINLLKEKYPVPKKEVWRTTINLAKVSTENSTYNKVPDDCEAWLDIRYIPEESVTIIKDVEKLLLKGLKLEVLLKEPPQLTNEKNLFVKKLRESTNKVTGKISPVIVKHGASDIRHYNQSGTDGVTFGPIGEGQHTDNEWVSIKSLWDYYRILKDYLLSLNNKI